MESQIPSPPTNDKFQCLNGGIIVATGSSESSPPLLECRCLDGFAGDYCETVLIGGPSLPGQEYPLLYNICLCVFLFILLPSIILYSIRTIYQMLKRCNKSDVSIIEDEVRRASESFRGHRTPNRMTVHFVAPVTPAISGTPRPAYRTFSLPCSATLVLAHPFATEDTRRLHKTTSWHHGVPLPPPPPPSYAASIVDEK